LFSPPPSHHPFLWSKLSPPPQKRVRGIIDTQKHPRRSRKRKRKEKEKEKEKEMVKEKEKEGNFSKTVNSIVHYLAPVHLPD
jgi:hypothetical protein